MPFDFFNISKRLYSDLTGLKGTTEGQEVKFVMKNVSYEDGELRPKTITKEISRNCIVTDLSNREKLLYQDYMMKGRRLISVRYVDKDTIFNKNIDLLKITNDCYIIVDNETYSIVDFISYKNMNMCRFICAYGGED